MSIWTKQFRFPKMPQIPWSKIPWRKLMLTCVGLWLLWVVVGNIDRSYVPEKIDYFALFEASYLHELTPPEDNGMRDILMALGPIALEQVSLAASIPWNEIPTHADSKEWFENTWKPICEKLGIADPYAKPSSYDYESLDTWFMFHGITGDEPPLPEEEAKRIAEWVRHSVQFPDRGAPKLTYERAIAESQRLQYEPWNDTDGANRQARLWLDHVSPMLDLFATAVRKPNYSSYYQRAKDSELLISILLPDVQFQRELARSTMVRIHYRIGSGDLDGAMNDILTLYYLSRKHYQKKSFCVIQLVGIAVETMADHAARIFLHHGNPTAEQLERFAKMLDAVPAMSEPSQMFQQEENAILDTAQALFFHGLKRMENDMWSDEIESFEYFLFDGVMRVFRPNLDDAREIIRQRYQELTQTLEMEESDPQKQELIRRWEQSLERAKLPSYSDSTIMSYVTPSVLNLFSERYRTQFFADYCLANYAPALGGSIRAFRMAESRFQLVRIGVSLERYRLAEGKYPERLSQLVTQGFLPENPRDPLTGTYYYYDPRPYTPPKWTSNDDQPNQPWTRPHDFNGFQASPYWLQSFGVNGKSELLQWHIDEVEELDRSVFLQSDDLQF